MRIEQDQITTEHNRAMDMAEMAFDKSPKDAKFLFKMAYRSERRCADSVDFEPSRSILYRSAASLAYNAGLEKEYKECLDKINIQ